MSGGYDCSDSFMEIWSNDILLILSKLSGAFMSSANTSFCSRMILFQIVLLNAIKSDVQVEVIHEVCCPANSNAICKPITLSSVVLDQSLW